VSENLKFTDKITHEILEIFSACVLPSDFVLCNTQTQRKALSWLQVLLINSLFMYACHWNPNFGQYEKNVVFRVFCLHAECQMMNSVINA